MMKLSWMLWANVVNASLAHISCFLDPIVLDSVLLRLQLIRLIFAKPFAWASLSPWSWSMPWTCPRSWLSPQMMMRIWWNSRSFCLLLRSLILMFGIHVRIVSFDTTMSHGKHCSLLWVSMECHASSMNWCRLESQTWLLKMAPLNALRMNGLMFKILSNMALWPGQAKPLSLFAVMFRKMFSSWMQSSQNRFQIQTQVKRSCQLLLLFLNQEHQLQQLQVGPEFDAHESVNFNEVSGNMSVQASWEICLQGLRSIWRRWEAEIGRSFHLMVSLAKTGWVMNLRTQRWSWSLQLSMQGSFESPSHIFHQLKRLWGRLIFCLLQDLAWAPVGRIGINYLLLRKDVRWLQMRERSAWFSLAGPLGKLHLKRMIQGWLNENFFGSRNGTLCHASSSLQCEGCMSTWAMQLRLKCWRLCGSAEPQRLQSVQFVCFVVKIALASKHQGHQDLRSYHWLKSSTFRLALTSSRAKTLMDTNGHGWMSFAKPRHFRFVPCWLKLMPTQHQLQFLRLLRRAGLHGLAIPNTGSSQTEPSTLSPTLQRLWLLKDVTLTRQQEQVLGNLARLSVTVQSGRESSRRSFGVSSWQVVNTWFMRPVPSMQPRTPWFRKQVSVPASGSWADQSGCQLIWQMMVRQFA